MNINSKDCIKESNNLLGYFGGIPQGRTYSKQPMDYCPSNPLNYIVGKCKVNPWFNYDICYTTGNGDNDITIYSKCISSNGSINIFAYPKKQNINSVNIAIGKVLLFFLPFLFLLPIANKFISLVIQAFINDTNFFILCFQF
jgi:hypothetical protein